jgi:drug/metabolite transporter (DMT)-like permease
MSPAPARWVYELLLLVAAMIWGSTFVAQQIGMERGLEPMTFNALRFALGCGALVPVLYWRSRQRPRSEAMRLPWKGAIFAGLFLFGGASCQQIGLQYTSSANAGFITGLYIVLVPLIGLALGHRAGRSLWLGAGVSLVGLYLLSVTSALTMNRGDVYVLLGAVMWAGQILMIDHTASRGDPLRIAFVQFAVCAALSAVASVGFETVQVEHVWAGAGAVAYAGVLSVGIAFTLQVVCQKRCPPGPAAVIMSTEAVFAGLAGWLVLNQTLTPRALVGCGLIFCGMLVVQLAPLAKKGKVR